MSTIPSAANMSATPSPLQHMETPPSSVPSPTRRVPIPKNGVDYRGKVVLAPMVRSGELPSRLLALHYGADLVWGPETIDQAMIGTVEKTNPRTGCIEWSRTPNTKHIYEGKEVPESVIYRIDSKRESDRLVFQMGTNNPQRAVQAGLLVAPYVRAIDVNSGCPKPFSTSGGMGAALLRTPDLLCSILEALVNEVGKPYEIGISVKIRLLETPELTSSLVNKLCKTGIIGLTIHCRTTPMRPRERAIRDQLSMIRDICYNHGVACLMNGDVASRDQALELMEQYKVDGAMIATAAEANSSVFRSKEQGGLAPWREVIIEYLRFAMSVENRYGNTKFLLSQLIPGKDPVYQKVTMSRSYLATLEVLGIKEEEMITKAKALDHILHLDEPKVSRADLKRQRKQVAKEKQETKQQGKRILEDALQSQDQQKRGRISSRSRSRSPMQKAVIAAENAGFDGIGEGALAVAM